MSDTAGVPKDHLLHISTNIRRMAGGSIAPWNTGAWESTHCRPMIGFPRSAYPCWLAIVARKSPVLAMQMAIAVASGENWMDGDSPDAEGVP